MNEADLECLRLLGLGRSLGSKNSVFRPLGAHTTKSHPVKRIGEQLDKMFLTDEPDIERPGPKYCLPKETLHIYILRFCRFPRADTSENKHRALCIRNFSDMY
jgi:hypothetical protein